MAEVYRRVSGEPIQRLIARHRTVQRSLERNAAERAMEARRNLKRNRDTGASKITMAQGDIDQYVILDDPFGFQIEYQASGEGLNILTDAFELGDE